MIEGALAGWQVGKQQWWSLEVVVVMRWPGVELPVGKVLFQWQLPLFGRSVALSAQVEKGAVRWKMGGCGTSKTKDERKNASTIAQVSTYSELLSKRIEERKEA